jgi:hypothetical protein
MKGSLLFPLLLSFKRGTMGTEAALQELIPIQLNSLSA